MSDIFREVEEEVRRERLEKIWKDYGDYIVAALALVILAGAGFRLWTYYESRERARASDSFIAAQQLLDGGQTRAAVQQFSRLSQTAPSGYAKLSELQAANALSAEGDTAGALARYRKLMDGGDEMLANVARLRAAWILVENTPKSQVQSMLGGMAAADSPWHTVAGEILAYADLRAGDRQHALAEYRALSRDPKSSESIRRRSQAMITYLTAGGDHDVGKPILPDHPVSRLLNPQKAAPAAAPQPTGNTPAGNSAQTAGSKATPPGQPAAPVTIDTNLPQTPPKNGAQNPAKGPAPK